MTLIEMQSYLSHPTIHIIFRSVVKRRKKHRDSDRDADCRVTSSILQFILFSGVWLIEGRNTVTLIEMQSYLFHPTIHIIFRSVVERRKKHRDSDRDAEFFFHPTTVA